MTGDARRGGSPRRGGGGVVARSLARVGACADGLRLMGVERAEVYTLVGRVGGDRGSLYKKLSRVCGPPAMEWMWSGPWGDGANCTTQGMVAGVGGLASAPLWGVRTLIHSMWG